VTAVQELNSRLNLKEQDLQFDKGEEAFFIQYFTLLGAHENSKHARCSLLAAANHL